MPDRAGADAAMSSSSAPARASRWTAWCWRATSAVNEAALTGESIPVDKAAGRQRLRRDRQPVRLPALPTPRASARTRRSRQIIQHGLRRRRNESADCEDRRQGLRRVRPGGHRASPLVTTVVWLLCRPDRRLCAGARHFRARHQLPVRAGPCHAGRHHGRQRHWREERHSVQNGRFAGRNRHASRSSRWIRPAPSPAASRAVTDILPRRGRDGGRAAAPRRCARAARASIRWPAPSWSAPRQHGMHGREVGGFPRAARQRPDGDA